MFRRLGGRTSGLGEARVLDLVLNCNLLWVKLDRIHRIVCRWWFPQTVSHSCSLIDGLRFCLPMRSRHNALQLEAPFHPLLTRFIWLSRQLSSPENVCIKYLRAFRFNDFENAREIDSDESWRLRKSFELSINSTTVHLARESSLVADIVLMDKKFTKAKCWPFATISDFFIELLDHFPDSIVRVWHSCRGFMVLKGQKAARMAPGDLGVDTSVSNYRTMPCMGMKWSEMEKRLAEIRLSSTFPCPFGSLITNF